MKAADSAYPVRNEVIPAFKKPLNRELIGDNATFNVKLPNIHVRVEHCIGILKNRFASLKGIRTMIRSEAEVGRILIWIRCCCILHNLLVSRNESESGYDNVVTSNPLPTEDPTAL